MLTISDSLRIKLNSWKTGENIRQTKYGDYFLLNEFRSEAELRSSSFKPYTIDLYFEVREQELSIFHIVIPPVNREVKITTMILFPSDMTLRILEKRNLAEILSEDHDLFSNFLDVRLIFGESIGLGKDDIFNRGFRIYLERYLQDIETKIKLEMDYPITFEDVEETENLELREKILQKFGYENYIREGFEKGKINYVIIGDKIFQYHNPGSNFYKIPEGYSKNRDDKIIFLPEDIAFLQVRDPSSGKIYFLKVPPDMRSVQEAKAWTFGLEKEEYEPEIET
ncbi:hypothetical protein ES703_21529 [subsurface metagenome]